MKQLVIFLFSIFLITIDPVVAQEQKTLSNERLESKIDVLEERINSVETKLTAKIDALETKLTARIDVLDSKVSSVEERLGSKIDTLFWIQGITVALIIFVLGYLIWDRRTALKPALDKALSADENSSRLLRAIKEYAQKHPELENILKAHGLL